MITDAVIAPILAVVAKVADLLPKGSPFDLPAMGEFWSLVGGLDALLPVVGVLKVAVAVLAAVVVFFAVRFVLLVWNLVWP